jgi:hypothetical protein
MDLPSTPSDQEVFSLRPAELRFREACHFLNLFRQTSGLRVPLGESRFLWVTNADVFLMTIASIRDVEGGIYKNKLMERDLFRFVQVMRNLTTHHFVVTSPWASFINRDISVHAGSPPVGAIDWEEPKLVQATVLRGLDQYETDLKAEAKSKRYKNEEHNIDAARKWAQENLTDPMKLSDVFEEVVKEVASVCGLGAKLPEATLS